VLASLKVPSVVRTYNRGAAHQMTTKAFMGTNPTDDR